MWWPFSIPEPYDARARTDVVSAPAPAGRDVIRPRSYATLGAPSPPPPSSLTSSTQATASNRPRVARNVASESNRQTVSEHVTPLTPEQQSARSLKQFSFFLGGGVLVLLSAMVTRRALVRKYVSMRPSGQFSPSNQVDGSGGSLDAFEALSLATLNVTSFAIMMVGGGLWAFDISSLDELRARAQKELGTALPPGMTEEQSEEEVEEWMATVLDRLQGKGGKGITDLVKDLQEKEVKKAQLQQEELQAKS